MRYSCGRKCGQRRAYPLAVPQDQATESLGVITVLIELSGSFSEEVTSVNQASNLGGRPSFCWHLSFPKIIERGQLQHHTAKNKVSHESSVMVEVSVPRAYIRDDLNGTDPSAVGCLVGSLPLKAERDRQ